MGSETLYKAVAGNVACLQMITFCFYLRYTVPQHLWNQGCTLKGISNSFFLKYEDGEVAR